MGRPKKQRSTPANTRSPQKRYTAAICGDGTILPIAESLGRRHLRDIDPLSSQGRILLLAGRVTLCYEDGNRVEAAPIQEVLDRMLSVTQQRRDVYPDLQRWTRHHDLVLRSINRMKSKLKTSH